MSDAGSPDAPRPTKASLRPMADPIKAFPKRLREAREAKGMSTEELAQRVHVSRQMIWLWERGVSLPQFRQLVAIRRVLGFDPLQR